MLKFNRSKEFPVDADSYLLPDLVPWQDNAVLVKRLVRRDRTVTAQGSLYAIVQHLQSVSDREWSSYSVSLPDRRSLPLMYLPKQFAALLRRSYWVKE